jgi:hypothetical protein
MGLSGGSSLTNMSKAIVTTTGLQQQRIVVNENQITDVKQAVAIDNITTLFSTTTSAFTISFPYTFPNTLVSDVITLANVTTALQTYNDAAATKFTRKVYEITTDSSLKSVHEQSSDKYYYFFKNQPSTLPELADYFPVGYSVVGVLDSKSEVYPWLDLQVYRNYETDTLYGDASGPVLVVIALSILGELYANYGNKEAWAAASQSDLNSIIGQLFLKKALEIWTAIETGEATVPGLQGIDLTDAVQLAQTKYMGNNCMNGAMVHLSNLAFSDTKPWPIEWENMSDIFEDNNSESPFPFVFFLNTIALTGSGLTGYIGDQVNSLTDETNLAYLSQRTSLNSEVLTVSYEYRDSDDNVIDITDNANDNTEVSSVNLTITNDNHDIVCRSLLKTFGSYFKTSIPSSFAFLSPYIEDNKFTIAQLKGSRTVSSSNSLSYESFYNPETSSVSTTNQLFPRFLDVMIPGARPVIPDTLVSV